VYTKLFQTLPTTFARSSFFYTAVYNNEPCQGVPDDLCNAKILGGHGEMWGETVDTSDLAQTVWPRLAAIGTLAKIEK
tara:strand:+ start:814 stop:1047 length:234 start_codon:yes stop_codon:yes gene_type:complete